MNSTATTSKRTEVLSFPTIDDGAKSAAYHWPEYVIEAAALATFMVSACAFSFLLDHPASPLRQMIGSAILRRCLVGLAMGLTATALIYSPWGKRSGAQMNPSVTLGFLYLGRIATRDAFFYIGAQFLGGALGVGLAAAVLGNRIAHQSVNYAITKPGASGAAIALAAECVISFVLFWAVLNANASPKLMKFTGVIAGTLVFLYISVEAPLSGMSMNPARSFASAVWPRSWTNQWIYFVAPPLAMLAAAELFRRRGHAGRGCAKLVHDPKHSCIFCGQPGRA